MSILAFPFVGSRQVKVLSWQQLLDAAETEAEVVRVARDYLASLDPLEVACLPDKCRPRKLVDAGDVGAYAFELARCHCEDWETTAEQVHRLAVFFVHANMRLSRILARTNDEDEEVRDRA